MDYNRVVKDLNGLTLENSLRNYGQIFLTLKKKKKQLPQRPCMNSECILVKNGTGSLLNKTHIQKIRSDPGCYYSF